MKRAIKAEAALEMVHDGSTVLLGGFRGMGSPHRLIDALVARRVRNLRVVANDTAMPGRGIGKLVSAGAIARLMVSQTRHDRAWWPSG